MSIEHEVEYDRRTDMYDHSNVTFNDSDDTYLPKKSFFANWKQWPSLFLNYLKTITPIGWVKIVVVLLVVIGIGLFLIFGQGIWGPPLEWFLRKIRGIGPLGWIIFIELYIAATILFIPGTILTLAAGFLYGLWVGLFVVVCGSVIGATAAYLYGNTILRSWIEKKIEDYPTFKAVDKVIEKRGWFIVFLLRLSPVIPFNVLNYALGLTSVSILPYIAASAIGMFPGTFVYVYIGTAIDSLASLFGGATSSDEDSSSSDENETAHIAKIVLFWVGLAATFILLIVITIIAKNTIQKAIKEVEDGEEDDYLLNQETGKIDRFGGVLHSLSEDLPPQ